MGACDAADQGFASGAIALSRSFFGVLGIAILGTLLAATMSNDIRNGLNAMNASPAVTQTVASAVHHGGAFGLAESPPPGVNRLTLMHVVERGFVAGWHAAMLLSAAVTIAFGLLIYAFIPSRKAARSAASS
jgi:hypothetical protein